MSSPYFDKRIDFFRSYYDKAKTYEEYLVDKNGGAAPSPHAQKWRDYEKRLALSPDLTARIGAFKRKMPILVLSGIWCGDCSRQGPMLRAIERSNSNLEMRFIDNKQNPELLDELRINGAAKVPVVVALSEDFFELARFGDRHLSVYRRKAVSELGPACDPGLVPPSGDELNLEVSEWVDFFERCQLILRLSPFLRERHQD